MGFRPGVDPDNLFFNIWFQIICSLGVAAIIVGIMAYNSGGRITINSSTYEDRNKSRVLDKRDVFIRTTTTKRRKPTESSGGGGGRGGGGQRGAPVPCRAVRSEPAERLLPVPRPNRCRQDRAVQGAGRIPLRYRRGDGADRHVRVHGETLRGSPDRCTTWLRRL